MKLGTNASGLQLPSPDEAPQFVRFGLTLSDVYDTAVYAALLVEQGKEPLPTAPWTHPDEGPAHSKRFKRDDYKWKGLVCDWSANVPGLLHIAGNEPPPDKWPLYFDRLRFTAEVLHADGHQVGLAPAITRRTDRFLREARTAGAYRWVDVVDVHPYAHTPEEMRDNVRRARHLVPERLPLVVSEFGWAVHQPGAPTHPFVVHPQTQADNMRDAVRLFHADGLLDAAYWFTWQDRQPLVGDWLWWWTCGMHTVDGHERPSAEVFRHLQEFYVAAR